MYNYLDMKPFCVILSKQRALCALRGEQRAIPESLRVLLQAGPLHGQQEEGE